MSAGVADTSADPLADPLGQRTIAARAAEALRRRILSGEYPGGFALRQDALAAELGASRIPIREALVQLEAEGLVTIKPHRGAVVCALSAAEADELFALRALLEPRLLARSAPLLTLGDFAALDAILAEYGARMRAHDPSRWGMLNTTLHLRLYAHAGQPRTAGIVTTLLASADRYTRIQLAHADRNGDRLARAEAEHAALVDLCREGAFAQACALLAAHIDGAREDLLALLAANDETGRPA
ncbi:GntR family transcriptional regulator [Salinarimonas chemoclinalis]|uniref:GntR family transcriptional regulator n=1 Tax=Salinarimonas chemoclinalis TaxID=3241599 RepID=UPI0035568F26